MLTVKIDRKKWIRGGGYDQSCLLRESDKKQCCIGFLARVLGLENEEILGCNTLASTNNRTNTRARKFENRYHTNLLEAYRVNDNSNLSELARMRTLRALGRKMQVRFVFSRTT